MAVIFFYGLENVFCVYHFLTDVSCVHMIP